MRLLSIQDLLTIQEMPSMDQITLQIIAMFYEEHLCNRQFYYELKHRQRVMRIRFKQGDLSHLLGVHHVIRGSKYAGELGFKKLKHGIITFDSLKQANIGEFKSVQFRMLYYPFIYQLIHDPIIVINHPHEPSRVQAMFTFYNTYTERFVELKLRRENKDNSEFFVPVSFVELRKIKPRTRVELINAKVLNYDDGYG